MTELEKLDAGLEYDFWDEGVNARKLHAIEICAKLNALPVTEEARPTLETALGGRILATPGHTADSLSLLLPDGSLFCGDAAMSGFPSLRHITIWAEDAAAFSRSWERLLSLKVRRIYPGHGRPFAPQALERCLPAARAMPLYPLPSR